MVHGSVLVALIVYILVREVLHARERKDLYDRIMSPNIEDYRREHPSKPPNPIANPIRKNIQEKNTHKQ